MSSRFTFSLTVALLVLGSLATGVVLVPGDSEMALIHLRGKQYQIALAEYERLGGEGDLSTGVVKSLCDLYLQRGEVERAVLLLERFVEANPSDLGARRRLGVLYQYAQRPVDFRINLEKIQRLDSDEHTLRQLARIYNASADYPRQIGILELLVNEHRGSAQDYLDLAYLQARQGRHSDAVAVMRRLEALYPAAVTEQSREVLINLLLDAGRKPEARQEAEEWLAQQYDWRMASRLGALFASRLHPELALALLKPFRSMASNEPQLMRQVIDLMIASGRPDEAFDLLESMHDSDRLPGACVAPLVDLALARSRTGLALAAATRGGSFERLPEWLKEGVVDAVRGEGGVLQARHLLDRLPGPWIEQHVFEGISLALVARDYEAAGRWAQAAVRQGLDPGEDYLYALVSAHERREAVGPLLAFELRRRLAGGELTREARGESLRLLVDMGLPEDALGGLADLAREDPGSWFTYFVEVADQASAADHVVALSCELLARENPTGSLQETIFYALFDHGGVPEGALPQLEAFALERGASWASAYEESLRGSKRQERLVAFWSARAALADTAEEERRAVAFKLLDAGQRGRAVEIFRQLARNAPAASQDLADLLSLWGANPPADARQWLTARARASPAEELASWISHLLNAGMSREAIEITGDRLPPAGEGGLLRGIFLDALRAAGESEKIVQMVGEELSFEAHPDRLGVLGVAALEAGDMELADHAFQLQLAADPQSVGARRQLGRLAFVRARYSLAKEYLAEVIAEDEGDFESRFFYGEILLRDGDRRQASRYYREALARLEEFSGQASRSLVIRAQLLHRLGDTRQARRIFDDLLGGHPEQNQLRADYVSLLLDEGDLSRASAVLAQAPPGGDDAGWLRLDLLEAALASRQGRGREAGELLAGLNESWPEDPAVLAALAASEEAAGRWNSALRHIDAALALGPANEDVYGAREELTRRRNPRAEVTFRQETGDGGSALRVAAIRFESPLSAALRAGVVHRLARVTLSSASGDESGRMNELFLRRDNGNGFSFGISFIDGGDGPGAGATFRRHDSRGQWDAALRLNEPYWDVAEAVDAGATRSLLSLTRRQRFSRGIEARALASLNRYDCSDCTRPVESLRVGFDLVYPLRRGRVAIAGHYLLDAEYLSSGGDSPHLAFLHREVHTQAFSIRGRFAERVPAALMLGYSWDRFGGQGINLGAELGYEINEGVRLQLSFGQQLGRSVDEGVVRHVTAGLVWTL